MSLRLSQMTHTPTEQRKRRSYGERFPELVEDVRKRIMNKEDNIEERTVRKNPSPVIDKLERGALKPHEVPRDDGEGVLRVLVPVGKRLTRGREEAIQDAVYTIEDMTGQKVYSVIMNADTRNPERFYNMVFHFEWNDRRRA